MVEDAEESGDSEAKGGRGTEAKGGGNTLRIFCNRAAFQYNPDGEH